ncbi:kinase-like domain-containing protein [Scleroderma yunnanense]
MGVSMQEVTSELDKSCVINLDKCIERIEPPIIFRGGNAIVYKGIHRPEGTMVALKMEKFPDDESPKRILYEALVWSKLSHKNIAPLCGFTITSDGSVSLVSPWQDRGNAHDYVQNSDVDPRPLLLGIARGVKYLHCHDSGPIAHGDLKGQNILIADHGRPLLTDFGSSSLPESSGTMILRPRGGGTLMWMAPEQLGDEIASVQSDVWAFGMTALELFTRKVPFQGVSTIPGLMARIMHGGAYVRGAGNRTLHCGHRCLTSLPKSRGPPHEQGIKHI